MVKDTRKIVQALNYIACSQVGGIVNCMKAYKLLWLADRYHLRQYGRTVSGDEYHALPHGPVPSDAMSIIEGGCTKLTPYYPKDAYVQRKSRYSFASVQKPDLDVFSESDREALNLILEKYGKMSPQELSEFSHSFPEWKAYEHMIADPALKNGYKIDMDLFFENREVEDDVFNDSPELLALTKELYHQYAC